MKLIKYCALALLVCLPVSCKSGTKSSGSASSPMTERVYLDGETSLSGQIIKASFNSKKFTLEVVFQNSGTEMVHFPLHGVTMEVNGINVAAKGYPGASMEGDIDLLPNQAKPKRYGFHTLEFGAGAPVPGHYNLTISQIMDANDKEIGTDLVIPFEVK